MNSINFSFSELAMELRRVLLKAALILFFIQFALARRVSLSSRIEWLALLELRSSLGIRAKHWPIKAEPCTNWTGVGCENGRIVQINVSGLRRTRIGRLNPRFAVDSLANFTLLVSFNASGFLLNGSIPDWFGQRLSALQKLDLRSCSLFGSIPPSLGDLRKLNSLFLSDNDLTGRIPSTLGQLSGLSILNLSRNSLVGVVPDSFSSLGNLTKLDLSSNFLSGSIPFGLGNLSSLRSLKLSDNSFAGSFPVQLGELTRLIELDLRENYLSGPLPDSLFSGVRHLQVLILSMNDFNESLPATLLSLPNLLVLDASRNSFTGPLPEFGSNNSTTSAIFNLSDNLFYGFLKTSLKKFKIIDLSGNYLQGEAPGDGGSNVIVARNCLRTVPNQRSLEDCRQFYVQKGVDLVGQEPAESPLSKLESRKDKRVIFILAGTFGGIGFILLLVLVLLLLIRKCDKRTASQSGIPNAGPVPDRENPVPPKDPISETGLEDSFTFEQVLHSTGNFAEANLIKHGHSGDLFRGILENGVNVVIKRVDLNSFDRESYMVEVGLLRNLSHARLVPLLGYCLENDNEKFLIYKYMPNGDLAASLHRVSGPDDKLQSLDWITRLKIAIGAAEGLSYLHECSPPLVHRDIQASSVLLDDKFEVRLGSLSQVTVQGDHQNVITKFFRKPQSSDQGTSGSPSVNCAHDIYCFGKVLLELVTGKLGVSKSDDATSREWLEQTVPHISIYDKEQVTKIVDPSLIVDEDLLEEVWAMAIVAKSCLSPKPSKRPPMRYVLKALENPLKVVREENYSSARLRTTSSRRSWSTAFFGSWRQSSSESATATGHMNKEGMSGVKQSGKVSSHGSGNEHSSNSHKRLSNEIFPEPLEMQDVETGEAR